MFSTPLIWFSSGAATVCSSTAADAPGYTARTVTTGGAISGYCAIGSTRIEASPAMTIKIDSTAAKIGLSIKKREIMISPCELFFVRGRRRGFIGSVVCRFAVAFGIRFRALRLGLRRIRGRGFRIAHLHRRTGTDFHHAIDNDTLARLEAAIDRPAIADPS